MRRPDVTSQASYTLTIHTKTENAGNDADASHELGKTGVYRATFVLGIPGINSVMGNVHFDELVSQGQSLIQVNGPADRLTLHYRTDDAAEPEIEIDVGINSDRRLQYLRLDVNATDLDDAHRQAYELVMPTLSRWSFIHNVGISVSSIELLEVATGVRQFDFTVVGQDRVFTDMAGAGSPEHVALLATFREGASSLELSYQALSFYKVVEGCYVLRQRRQTAAVAAGQSYRDPGERFPLDYVDIDATDDRERHRDKFSPFLGKKFREVHASLRNELRNSLAHLDMNADPFTIDTWNDLVYVRNILPILRYMAQTLLAAELEAATAAGR